MRRSNQGVKRQRPQGAALKSAAWRCAGQVGRCGAGRHGLRQRRQHHRGGRRQGLGSGGSATQHIGVGQLVDQPAIGRARCVAAAPRRCRSCYAGCGGATGCMPRCLPRRMQHPVRQPRGLGGQQQRGQQPGAQQGGGKEAAFHGDKGSRLTLVRAGALAAAQWAPSAALMGALMGALTDALPAAETECPRPPRSVRAAAPG